jgi:probable O-glycosylation ligase (exosortase A-associated)
LKFISTAGGHHVRGVGKFGDNNHFAVALAMCIPCLYYLVQVSRSKLIRLGSIVAAVITVLAIVGTSSRGGMLCIAAMGAWLAMTSRRKVVATLFVLMCAGLVVALAPESWTERMDTIKTADEDSSFMQRVEAWQVSSAMALENPIFGGGFRAIEVQAVWEKFRGSVGFMGFLGERPPSEIFRAAHSVYFQIMGDLGLVGFVIFMAFLGNVFVMRRTIHKRAKAVGGDEWRWAVDLSNALAASVFAYMVGGAAVSLGYFETMYMMVMLMAVLQRHVLNETKKPEEVRL